MSRSYEDLRARVTHLDAIAAVLADAGLCADETGERSMVPDDAHAVELVGQLIRIAGHLETVGGENGLLRAENAALRAELAEAREEAEENRHELNDALDNPARRLAEALGVPYEGDGRPSHHLMLETVATLRARAVPEGPEGWEVTEARREAGGNWQAMQAERDGGAVWLEMGEFHWETMDGGGTAPTLEAACAAADAAMGVERG